MFSGTCFPFLSCNAHYSYDELDLTSFSAIGLLCTNKCVLERKMFSKICHHTKPSTLQRCVCLFVRAVLAYPSVHRARRRESSCKSVTAGAIATGIRRGALF